MSDPAIARNGQWTALASMFDHIPREGRNNPYRVAVFMRPGPHDLGIGRQSARRRVKGFGAGTQIARSRPAGEAQPPASNLTPTIRLSRAAFAGDDNSDAVCRNRPATHVGARPLSHHQAGIGITETNIGDDIAFIPSATGECV